MCLGREVTFFSLLNVNVLHRDYANNKMSCIKIMNKKKKCNQMTNKAIK